MESIIRMDVLVCSHDNRKKVTKIVNFIVLSPKELANTVLYPFGPFSVVPQRITLMPNATEFMFNKRIVPV